MIWAMLAEETRQLLQGDRREVTTPIIEPMVKADRFEEGVDRNRCSYEEFTRSSPQVFMEIQHW